ncbi:MAG: S41 family peptidase, partial [Desulfovermiculus sp.]
RALRAFLLAVVWLAVPGWVFAAGEQVPLDEIREILRTRLYPPPEETKLQALTLDHLAQDLKNLDPYARYYQAETSLETILPDNQLSGIGAQLFEGNGQILLSPFPRGPLTQAGVSERAELLEVNGHSVQGLALHDIAAMIQGKPESLVQLRIRPLSADSGRTVIVVRSSFRPLDVELIQTAGQPVLRIRDFIAGQTRSALKASIDFLDLREGPLIIDLRESGGGDLFEALDCAGLFVAQGKSLGGLETRDLERTLISSPPGRKISVPVVLLVGPDTASAAEVFAAALAYHGLARLVGRPTFGKCTTQTEVTLSDGSVLRVTNGRILVPEGSKCSAEGLIPDVLIPEYRLYNDDFLLDQVCTSSASKPQSR